MSTHTDTLLTWNNQRLNLIAVGVTLLAFRLVGIFPTTGSNLVMGVVGLALFYIYYAHQHNIYAWAVKLWNKNIHIEGDNKWETSAVKMLCFYVPNMTAALICFESVRQAPLLATTVQLPILWVVSIFWARNMMRVNAINVSTKSARYVNFDDYVK